MEPTAFHLRRATVDDLKALRALWESMRFAVPELEPRLTEFQVAEDPGGKIAGAIGFQMTGRQGLIHGEAFEDFSLAETIRPLFWQRIHTLAMNHGIVRLWTLESAPFWNRQGLIPATLGELQKLPPAWPSEGVLWLTLQLKSEEAFASAEKEIERLLRAEKARTARALRRATLLKNLATAVAITLALFVGAALVYLLRRSPSFSVHGR